MKHLTRSTGSQRIHLACRMISDQLNIIKGLDPDKDKLRKLGNRVKTLRIVYRTD